MSKRFVAEPAFFENIAVGLERELGSAYDVIRRPRFQRWLDLREPADLAVRERESGQTTLIEIKVGILEDDELPLATAAELRRIQTTNVHLQPKVVLVSAAIVGEPVERWLATYDIPVIRGRTSGEIVPQLAEFITAGSVAHR
jgi:hypothetical protein